MIKGHFFTFMTVVIQNQIKIVFFNYYYTMLYYKRKMVLFNLIYSVFTALNDKQLQIILIILFYALSYICILYFSSKEKLATKRKQVPFAKLKSNAIGRQQQPRKIKVIVLLFPKQINEKKQKKGGAQKRISALYLPVTYKKET